MTASPTLGGSTKTFGQAAAMVLGARSPGEIFGDPADEPAGRRIYRRLARRLHPDHATATDAACAQEATARLNVLWDQHKKGADGGVTVTSKRFTYTVGTLLGSDDLSNLYACSWEQDGVTREGALRLPRDARDNDLVGAEAKALKRLNAAEERFRPYAPTLVDAFRYRDAKTSVTRQAVITAERPDGLYSLAEVQRAYPGGIGGRDAAWMWRRLLAGAGWAHRAGVVQGAILPEHVFIHPDHHGVVLANWCYSALDGAAIPAMVSRYADWYPASVANREPATPATDVHMIARTMLALLGPRAATPFRAFARGCTRPGTHAQDAWEVQRDFDELLERLYGRRRFHPFHMPA